MENCYRRQWQVAPHEELLICCHTEKKIEGKRVLNRRGRGTNEKKNGHRYKGKQNDKKVNCATGVLKQNTINSRSIGIGIETGKCHLWQFTIHNILLLS